MSHYDSEMMVAVAVAKTAMPMMRLLNRAKSRRSEALDSTANSCSRTSNGGSGGDGSTDEDANAHVCRSSRDEDTYTSSLSHGGVVAAPVIAATEGGVAVVDAYIV